MPNTNMILIPLPDGVDVFKVENDQSVPKTVRVATIEYKPKSSMYVVRGNVQYRDVEGVAYLEMWNVMPDLSVLAGITLMLGFPVFFLIIRRRYAQVELRKMQALDA